MRNNATAFCYILTHFVTGYQNTLRVSEIGAYSAHLQVMQQFGTKSLKYVIHVIANFDLHTI